MNDNVSEVSLSKSNKKINLSNHRSRLSIVTKSRKI